MIYPKPIMRLSSLVELGFPREYLMDIYRNRYQTVAWKMNGKKNSPILFDTMELEKYRKNHCCGR